MYYRGNYSPIAFKGKVYCGPKDPAFRNDRDEKNWVEIKADSFHELYQKASRIAGSRFRMRDRIKLSVLNHQELQKSVSCSRYNRITEDNKIEYGLWMLG